MYKKIFLIVVFIGLVQCALSSPASAQATPVPDSCIRKTDWAFPIPIPLGWFYVGPYPGTYTYQIGAMKCSVEPTNRCLTCAGKPISLAGGDTFIEEKDVAVPGLGGGLSLQRTWRSVWPSSLYAFRYGVFGPHWRSTYEEQIVVDTNGFIRYIRGDGTVWTFGQVFSGASITLWGVVAPENLAAILDTDTSANPYFTVTFQSGETRRFDSTTGNLIAIIDRNGNTTTVAYDSSGRLATVTDAASRTLTFTYGTGTSLVASVSSSVGVSLSYSYDTSARLSQVTYPDSSTVNFTYNSQSLITSVTDSNGKVLESHTYDSNARGLTSARAGGVEAVTVSYPH
jgi:YD repeat-containing protein